MKTYWGDTKTFFPIVLGSFHKGRPLNSACIVGGADGKFVIPLLQKGILATAIEKDVSALDGCVAEFPIGVKSWMPGLYENIKSEGLEGLADVINIDFMEFKTEAKFDLVFTSCSWHYSMNFSIPVSSFVSKMQSLVKRKGIFAAEYMMPCGDDKSKHANYLREGQLKEMFCDIEWEVLDEFYTEVFTENPHVGNLLPHNHRMGFLIATKI